MGGLMMSSSYRRDPCTDNLNGTCAVNGRICDPGLKTCRKFPTKLKKSTISAVSDAISKVNNLVNNREIVKTIVRDETPSGAAESLNIQILQVRKRFQFYRNLVDLGNKLIAIQRTASDRTVAEINMLYKKAQSVSADVSADAIRRLKRWA
jgi:hypothetical protein